ncbi:chemotaxis protein CheB [Fulvivirga kasyanovii]|nr:chemotaxis protein CheB [Fulvivirga kasyanovii]
MTDDIYITGIGASAGGTDALKTFFENIPEKPNTAFIIIQHLDRKQKGFTKEALTSSTSLPISQVDKRTKITKNHIYLIPPKYYILLEDHHLVLEERPPLEKVNTAINTFFTSLARHNGDKSIAIILSGLGSDGAKGSQYVKEQGGMVMVQSPDSATYSSMPLGAIISDQPDVIGPPEKLAKDLIYYINQPSSIDKAKDITSNNLIKEIEKPEAELSPAKKQHNSDQLEAINEELQSSNEELKTANAELKNKIDELTILHREVNNLFMSTQIATIFLDRDKRIRKFTPAVQKYFNVREGDMGRPIYHYTNNFSYGKLREDIDEVLTSMLPVNREIKEKNGYALMKIIPYKTNDMRIEGVIVTFIDITELKETNLKLENLTKDLKERSLKLEQSENYWKTLVENTPDIVCRLNKNGIITYVNNNIFNHTGIESGRLMGKNLMQFRLFIEEDEVKELQKQLDMVFKHKKQINYYQNFSTNNSQKHFFITLLPEWSVQSNKLESVLLVGRDISNLRNIELRIEDKNRKLEELNQYMDNFVHAVAHDLRSPLTNLKLILELIEDESDPDKQEFLISRLGRSVSRIDDILNGLIEIIGSQKRTDELAKKINFHRVIKKVLEQLSNELPKDVEVKLDIQAETIVHTRGYLYSIIRNLLSNAIKYRSDDRPLVLNISTKQEGEYVVMDIKDNGIGMDFEVIKHDLFKPFKRFTSKADGKGIGLHIIKSMIEKTGGKIEVNSEKGKGTTFSVYFKNQ